MAEESQDRNPESAAFVQREEGDQTAITVHGGDPKRTAGEMSVPGQSVAWTGSEPGPDLFGEFGPVGPQLLINGCTEVECHEIDSVIRVAVASCSARTSRSAEWTML
ncbi:hypothetical protein NCCP2495_01800 [Dietzia sp. NCCP-2495]|nr:hypothetical protein NCCP2495_01800 [Dietzia sp. NCCP-2495]